ncbi:LCP family protein [Sporosarcina contaminans]|uniref:Regulatory protein MsrR n=1 Tax=Sporosarcina contaminans TaxID=633403 RepID=A0ABW3TUA7_9BACL
MRRTDKKKKRGRKAIKIALALLLICIGLGVYYWVDQYKQGQSLAEDSSFNKKDKDENDIFDGPEPQYGEINVLLLGTDARKDEDGRSDSLMIAHYNQDKKEAKLISIMRDTYVDIPNHGKQKINAAFSIGGPELVRQTIKENFGLDVHYYAMVDFKGFPKIVDIIAPNGIEVDIPYPMSHGIGMTLQPGVQTLHGDQLLGYVRFRYDYKNDFGRVERQQEVLTKLKEEAVSLHSLMSLPKLLGAADGYIDTNLDKMTMLSIAKGILDNKSQKIATLRIPIDNSYDDPDTNVGRVLDIDFETNIKAIEQFLDDSTDLADKNDKENVE